MKHLLPIVALLVGSLVPSALAQPGPARPAPLQPSPFGIAGLKPRYGKDLPNVWSITQVLGNYMIDAGATWDRAEIAWSDVQPAPGQWDWSFTDKMVDVYRKRPIRAYVLLEGTAPWLSAPPRTDAERAQYADFVYNTVNRYKDVIHAWEIWNEENIPSFWQDPNPKDYADLLKAAYAAVKRADPTATVITGGTSTVDLGFIRKVLFDNGGWDYADAVAIHPYSMGGGPASQDLPELLRMTRAAVTKDGVAKPVWITEVGWTTDTTLGSELRQADYLLQEYTIALAEGVEKVFWFTLGDWSERWGLIAGYKNVADYGYTSTNRTKRAFYTLKHLTERLAPTGGRPSFGGYMPNASGLTAMAFYADGNRDKPVLVLWAPYGKKATYSLGQKEGLHALDARGKTVPITDGRILVTEVPMTVIGFKPGAFRAASFQNDPTLRRPGKNLVMNPSMELADGEDVAFWNRGRFPEGGTDATLEWTKDASGNRGLSLSSAKDGAWTSTPIPVWAGRRYTLTARVTPAAATGDNRIAIAWYTGTMWTWLSQDASDSVTGSGDARTVTISGTAPKDAVFARIVLSSKDNTGRVSFDDVTLTEG